MSGLLPGTGDLSWVAVFSPCLDEKQPKNTGSSDL